MTNILFISWDGPHTSYMEGLFIPIFKEIGKKTLVNFHIIQFTWGNKARIKQTELAAAKWGISYISYNVLRKPTTSFGSLLTLIKGVRFINNYIKENEINIVMPRSTMPTIMVNRIKNKDFKIIFDADGLPLQERVESGKLKRNSLIYRFLLNEEFNIIKRAEAVLVRSTHAIEFYLDVIPDLKKEKFQKVINGRDVDTFNFNKRLREKTRNELKIKDGEKLLIYVGSLGSKYGLNEMMSIYRKINNKDLSFRFLILTPSINYVKTIFSSNDLKGIIIKAVPFKKVNKYLSAADFALCLINQSTSMKAASPTKLGEYLLAGLPTIITSEIGDVSETLKASEYILFLKNHSEREINRAVKWVLFNKNNIYNKQKIRKQGIEYFSLEKSAESYVTVINKML